MHMPARAPVFENRYDAGRQLAEKLTDYKGQSAIVLAIPNGGAPIALGVALALEAELDIVVSRKIPLPLSPEGGFGAVTDDGTIILNEEMVAKAGLSPQQINYQVSQVRVDIHHRSLLYRGERRPAVLADKTVIIIDDGLASGYTMRAAVESVRQRHPGEIIVAVPVASAKAFQDLGQVADRVTACIVNSTPEFYVADFYRYWNEPDDGEVIQCFKEWRLRRSGRPDLELPKTSEGS